MDFIVPIAMELVPSQTHASEFLVFDLGSGRVAAGIDFSMNLESLRSGRGGDEIDDHLVAQQRFSAPVLTDETEQPVLDLVPLACARRKMADSDPQSRFIGQLLQFHLPEPETWSVTASSIRRDEQSMGLWI